MKNRILADGKLWISLTLMVIGATVALMAYKWPFRTALFPVSIGLCVFFMALADMLLGLFGKEEGLSPKEDAAGATPEDRDQKIAWRRTVGIFAWIGGFFLMIILLGFPVAVPLLVFLYLKVQNKESWRLTLILTGSTVVFFYGLFVWIIETPFPDGLLVRWLG